MPSAETFHYPENACPYRMQHKTLSIGNENARCALCGYDGTEQPPSLSEEAAAIAAAVVKMQQRIGAQEMRIARLRFALIDKPESLDYYLDTLYEWIKLGGTVNDLKAAATQLQGNEWKSKYEQAVQELTELRRGQGRAQ